MTYDIRIATEEEYRQAAQLYCDTVRAVNCRDYSPPQIEAWLRDMHDMGYWMARRAGRTCYAAFDGPQLVGFAELEDVPAIDCLYCHKDYQRQGVGSALMKHLLREAASRGFTYLDVTSCVTARPFFAKHGFVVTRDYLGEYNGQQFQLYDMRWGARAS